MKILSIDVGIKNLAFCILDKSPTVQQFKITKWDIINLSEERSLKCGFIEKSLLCNKQEKFKKEDTCYCAKHSKKQNFKTVKPYIRQIEEIIFMIKIFNKCDL